MTYPEILKVCNDIVCNPDKRPELETLDALIMKANEIDYALHFHVGQNLLGEPYIQGFILEEKCPTPSNK